MSKEHAIQMLTELSGQTHSVITAVTLLIRVPNNSHCTVQFFEETLVKFSELTQDMIEAYVETGTPMYEHSLSFCGSSDCNFPTLQRSDSCSPSISRW